MWLPGGRLPRDPALCRHGEHRPVHHTETASRNLLVDPVSPDDSRAAVTRNEAFLVSHLPCARNAMTASPFSTMPNAMIARNAFPMAVQSKPVRISPRAASAM